MSLAGGNESSVPCQCRDLDLCTNDERSTVPAQAAKSSSAPAAKETLIKASRATCNASDDNASFEAEGHKVCCL